MLVIIKNLYTWGISDSQNLNFAVFANELDNLVYGAPMSLAEFYNLTTSGYDILLDWLLNNYNATYTSSICYEYFAAQTLYSISYDFEDDYLFLEVFWEFDDGANLYLLIDLSYDPSQYVYYVTYFDDWNENVTLGYINAATFTENTNLTASSYTGEYWDKTDLMDLYRLAVVDLLEWFDWATVYYGTGVTIEDLGFVSFN